MEIDRESNHSLDITYQDVHLLLVEISKLKKGSECLQEAKQEIEASFEQQREFYFRPAFMFNRFHHMIKIEETMRVIHAIQQEGGQEKNFYQRLHCVVPNTHGKENPDEIDVVVNSFIGAIDRLLHAYDHNEHEYELIETIVTACPKFLTRKSERAGLHIGGLLPIDCVVNDLLNVDTKLLSLFLHVGGQSGLGDLSLVRGGLFLKPPEQVFGTVKANNLLQTIVELKNIQILNKLLEMQPPLLRKEDVKNHHLLKYAVMNNPIGRNFEPTLATVKLILKIDPSCVYHPDEDGKIPLFYSFDDSAMVRVVLQSSIKFDPFHESIGGLFSFHESGKYVIDFMLGIKDGENWYQEPVFETQRMREKRHWDGIESIISPFQTITILHKTIECCPHLTPDVLQRFPNSIYLRDGLFRLPIHQALDRGLNWDQLAFVLHANCQSLDFVDPVKKLPLFALAANDSSCDLRTIYHLLRRSPELLCNSSDVVESNKSPKTKKMRMNL